MAHEIYADSTTAVGYSFITKEYYVKNLDTKTTVQSYVEAKQILDITAPFNSVSEHAIYNLSQEYEPLTSIQYCWEDTGKYIKAIYFNDYKDYAIVYNEPYLYIKGSVEMWDMSSSLGKDTIREFFWAYFRYNLGLDISTATFRAIVNYYEKIQSPYVYNNIVARESTDDTLMYSNVLTVNNPDGSSRGEYTGTKNPDNLYSTDVYNVVMAGQVTEYVTHNIHSMQVTGNTILLTDNVSDIKVNDVITVLGTDTKNDKEYHVTSVGNQILQSGLTVTKLTTLEYVVEDFISNMYAQGIVRLSEVKTVTENSITTDTEPLVSIGDTMQLRGSANVNNLTVERIEGNKIIFKESTPVGVHTEEDNVLYASAYNITKIGYDTYNEVIGSTGVSKISGTKVYISGWLYEDNFKVGQEVYINYGTDGVKGPFKITAVTPTSMSSTTVVEGYITLGTSPNKDYTSTLGVEPVAVEVRNTTDVEEDSITVEGLVNLNEDEVIEIKNSESWNDNYTVDYTETIDKTKTKIWLKEDDFFKGFDEVYKVDDQTKKAVMQVRVYSEKILLNMTYSKRADRMPTGEFMLDNDQQFTNYLQLYHIVQPTSTNYADLSQPVSESYFLAEDAQIQTMNCVGLYTEVYGED